MLRRFALHAFLPAPVSELKLEGLFNLLLRAAHREFARRDKSELHADGIRVLDRHVEVLGPRLLVFLRLLGIKRRNRRRWCLGRPTMPARTNLGFCVWSDYLFGQWALSEQHVSLMHLDLSGQQFHLDRDGVASF